MAISVAQAFLHATTALKLPEAAFSAEVVRSANDLQARISTFHFWHWLLTAATNIAVSQSTQDYTMAAGNQNRVQEIADANLLSGSTQLPALLTRSSPILPRSSTEGQPHAVGLISPTQLRLYLVPDATYTLQWRYYAQPVVFTSNSDSYQCPDTFEHVVLQGNIWKVMQLLDDERQDNQYNRFIAELTELRRSDLRTAGRRRM